MEIEQLITYEQFKQALPSLLSSIPKDWRGTTFNNSSLLGRELFSQKLQQLIKEKQNNITTEDLTKLGNAEDYLRVSSNISCVLETTLALQRNRDISTTFTFASNAMAMVAILLNTKAPVRYYVGENGSADLDETFYKIIQLIHQDFQVIKGSPLKDEQAVVITNLDEFENLHVDAVYKNHILYINNTTKINPSDVMVIRKRTTTPVSTPFAINQLQQIAGVEITEANEKASEEDVDAFYNHLQTMSGVSADLTHKPVCCTAGLPSLNTVWVSLALQGGADILMASTAYGGSSQLTDVMTEKIENINKHKFDITGKRPLVPSIKEALDGLASKKDSLKAVTTIITEVPTNPDMKVPNISELCQVLNEYRQNTGKQVLLIIDTTFAPASQVLAKIREADATIPSIAFISLSKSVSRGFTCAGAIVSGETDFNTNLYQTIDAVANAFDTKVKKENLLILSQTHQETELRNKQAYEVAVKAGQTLQQAVRDFCNGYQMDINFPNTESALIGFTSSTFSFNLPPLPNGTNEQNAGLAQKYVDYLAESTDFKPCVSFGQDNQLVYATVPATSTQGAIKEEDKAKQAVGGVQLVRLSFPPTTNLDAVLEKLRTSVQKIYA